MLGVFYQPGPKHDMNGARIDIIIQNEDANIANNERIRVRFNIRKLPFILFPILYAMTAITNPKGKHRKAKPPKILCGNSESENIWKIIARNGNIRIELERINDVTARIRARLAYCLSFIKISSDPPEGEVSPKAD